VTARRIFVALLALLAALDLLIVAIRVADVFTLGRLIFFPAEGPVLYAIWKVRTGHPLYEWPTRPYFTLTLYNFLFYKSYAAIFAVLRVSNDGMMIAGRFVTLAFAFAGAVAQYVAGRRITPRSFRIPLALLSLVTWIGCALPGWWSLALRPDVPAAALGACGVALALHAFQSGRRGWFVVSGAAFLLAWTFKQSQIALFAATCAYIVLWRRSFKELLLIMGPFAIGGAIAMDVGGAVYRANVIDAPRVNALIPYLTLYWYRDVALIDLLLWGMALYAIVALARPGSIHGPLRSIDDVPGRSRKVFGADLTYPALVVLAAFAGGSVLLAKVGSAPNHLLELNLAASLACAAVLGSLWDTPKASKVCAAGALMLAPMLAFDAALLAGAERAQSALLLKSWGVSLHLTTPQGVEPRRRLEAIVAELPKPLFIDDELFAQPWHATGNRYPTVLVDHVFYDAASAKGLIVRGVEGLLTDRYFAAVAVPDSSPFFAPAMHAGYRLARTVPMDADEPMHILLRDR
jgi:hypothetical protein